MNTIAETPYQDDELSLQDVVDFLSANWLTILAAGAAGLIAALTYVWVAPPVHEATLQIEMARTNGTNTSQNADVRGVPIEEAQLLVERLRLPSTYTPAVSSACSPAGGVVSNGELAKQVRARAVKSVTAVVEITVEGRSTDQARACALAVFEMVREQQNQLLQPFLNEANQDIEVMSARLKENQAFLESMEKSSVQSAVYLAKRDESLWLMDQVATLNRSLRQTTQTRLVSPIYAKDEPVSPRAALAIAAGVMLGLTLGFLVALIRSVLRKRTPV